MSKITHGPACINKYKHRPRSLRVCPHPHAFTCDSVEKNKNIFRSAEGDCPCAMGQKYGKNGYIRTPQVQHKNHHPTSVLDKFQWPLVSSTHELRTPAVIEIYLKPKWGGGSYVAPAEFVYTHFFRIFAPLHKGNRLPPIGKYFYFSRRNRMWKHVGVDIPLGFEAYAYTYWCMLAHE